MCETIHQLDLKEQIMQSELQRIFIKLSEQYIRKFCEKHGFTFDGWVGSQTENIGQVASFEDGFIFADFNDIRYDIDSDCHKDLFPNWYDSDKGSNFINFVKFNG